MEAFWYKVRLLAIRGAVAKGLASAAPKLAESAYRHRRLIEDFGKSPGMTIIVSFNGIRPGTIAEQTQGRSSLFC